VARGDSGMADSDRIPIGRAPLRGRRDALVTMVAFGDFQCPFCQRVEETLARVREHYGDDLRIVWRNAPLPFHPEAQLAAEAAMEAFAQRGDDGFWRYHDTLFDHQNAPGGLQRPALEQYAQQQGLDIARFRAALDQNTHAPSVQHDVDLASRLGAEGVPYFYVNGTPLVGAQPYEAFVALIDPVLERARTIQPRSRAYAQMVLSPVDPPEPAARPSLPPTRVGPPQLDASTVYRVPARGAPQSGPADALVTIVVFSDFQCPFCARVLPTLEAIRSQYGRDVRVVFRQMPLDFHPDAMLAAEASLEAFAQRGDAAFWSFHDTLFRHQQDAGGLQRPALEQYAQALGMDMGRFRSALDQHTHRADVDSDRALAQSLAANGTPHFFVNGRRLVGAQPVGRFTALIDEVRTSALAHVRAGTPRGRLYDAIVATGASAPVYVPTAPTVPSAPSAQPDVDEYAPVHVVRPNPAAPTLGPVGAPVTVEVLTDFQCPFCGRAHPIVEQLQQHYGAQVRWVHRDYPLPFHVNAMPAAEAAREVLAQQGAAGFWRFAASLFRNQQQLDRAGLERLAVAQHVNMARFRAALAHSTHRVGVQDDIAAVDAAMQGQGVGTPSFLLNGHLMAGAQPFDAFRARIDALLQAAGRNPPVAPSAALGSPRVPTAP